MSIIEKPSGALFDSETSEYLYPDPWMVEQGYMCLKIIGGEPVIRITELGIEYMRDRLRSEAQG
ncbi:hypothetical protein OG824_04105 [Streptomyces prunicolor]|uniref:hypothetical protein n=1 Tax=Streptomyces prunicolor TaxID=67348 RepID=UPI00224E85FA|nr:hypothetical protein [Streptomyces prunicolor]MCX5234416.1 hypothetical protein [Streptomyces prunicolor]